MRRDGSGDRRLVLRNGGSGLGWTPDGRRLVYDEPEIFRTFRTRSDLRVVDRRQRTQRGASRAACARASPTSAPTARRSCSCARTATAASSRSWTCPAGAVRDLTRSEPGRAVELSALQPGRRRSSRPRAWRRAGGSTWCCVDAGTGEIVERLTEDRAKDVEPAWTPDGTPRSCSAPTATASRTSTRCASRTARCCASPTCWAARSRRTSIPSGGAVVFSNYTSRGYDVHRAPLDLGGLPPADPFEDPYPAARPLPPPADGPDRPYRPVPDGAAALLEPVRRARRRRVAWGHRHRRRRPAAAARLRRVDVHWGSDTERVVRQAYYQYDRFRPTFARRAPQRAGGA